MTSSMRRRLEAALIILVSEGAQADRVREAYELAIAGLDLDDVPPALRAEVRWIQRQFERRDLDPLANQDIAECFARLLFATA